jgi:hypothetical protein
MLVRAWVYSAPALAVVRGMPVRMLPTRPAAVTSALT